MWKGERSPANGMIEKNWFLLSYTALIRDSEQRRDSLGYGGLVLIGRACWGAENALSWMCLKMWPVKRKVFSLCWHCCYLREEWTEYYF